MDEYAKGKYLQHPSPFLGYTSWWRVKCKATEGYALKPELCCQWCFQCWQKEDCSLSPGMCSWLQHSAAAPGKPHWENAWCKCKWKLAERWASPMHSVLASLTFLLATTACDFLSCPGLSLHRTFLADGPSKQLCPLQLFLQAMLPRKTAEQLVHTQPLWQIVHWVNLR